MINIMDCDISEKGRLCNSCERENETESATKKILEFKTSRDLQHFTGGVILQDDKFLIAQYSAKALEMYDSKGNLLSKLSFDGNPWCVEMTGDTSGATTVWDKSLLVFFNITGGNNLVEMKRVPFEKHCYDVRCYEDKLYMACNEEIMILDTNGTSTGKIFPLSSEARFVDIDPQGKTLCYSSNNCNILTCIGMDGSEIFTYRSDDLSSSSSVSRDFAGNIYVVGYSSGNVHQLDRKGQFNQIIVSGLSRPYTLKFQKHSSKFITNSDGKAIVYEIV